MDSIKKHLKDFSFIFLWIIGGVVHKYVGAFFVVATFLLMLKKRMYVRVLVSFWLLLIFSDSTIELFSFAPMIKPVIMLLLGVISLLLVLNGKIDNPFILPFFPFFLYIIISTVFHPEFVNSFATALSYIFIYLVPASLLILIIQQGKSDDLMKALIFAGNSILFVSLFLGFFIPDIGDQFLGRMNGIFRNPNGVGIFLVMYSVLSYVIFNTIEFSKRSKQLTFLLIVLLLIFSGARSSIGSIIIFFVGISLSKKSPWIFALFTVFFFFVFQTVFDLAIMALVSLGYSELFRLDTLAAASGRVYVWRAAWEVIEDNFFFGKGFNYSENLAWLRNHLDSIPELKTHDGNVHQSFLSIWMNNGIIGLVLFVLGWVSVIFKSIKKSHVLLPLVACVVFSASYESWLVASLNPFTIQLIFVFSIIFYYDKIKVSSRDEENSEAKEAV